MSVQTVSFLAALLAVVATAAAVGIVVTLIGGRFFGPLAAVRDWGVEFVGPAALWLAWIVALAGLVGSLYFSEVADFAPCDLCWYQRIAMYPLALILGIAALRNDAAVRAYALPLIAVGMAFSTYHHLLQLYPDLETGLCGTDTSCVTRDLWEFGFVSFPFTAFAAFLLMAVLLVVAGRASSSPA